MDAVNDKIELKKYRTYKNSGAEWLGEIPEHWQTLSNKYIFKVKKNQVGRKSNEYVLLSLTLNGIIKRDMNNPQGKFPTEFDTYQEVRKGDFVFCLFDVEETPRTVGLSSFNGMITGAYSVMEANKDFDRNFLYYFYLNLDAKKRMKPLYKGLRNVIPKETFLSFKTFIPPKDEQTAIASFLDRKIAQIEKAIAQKEKLIELLKERRQIVIHNAVTQGLNRDVKFKYSGVEWIGVIPEHWQVKPLRFIGKTQNGISKGAEYFGSGFPFLSYGDVYKDIELPRQLDGLVMSVEEEKAQYSVVEGDVYFTRTSETREEIGFASTCLSTIEKATFAGFLIRFRPEKGVLHKYFSKFYFSSQTHRAFFVKEMNLVTRASLSQELLKKMPVLIPPIEEQERIGDFLETASNSIFAAISIKEQEINRLKEYKVIIINATVTGKIKVFS